MTGKYRIEQLTSFSPEDANQLRILAQQIGTNYKELTDLDIKEMLASPMHFLFVSRENESNNIVGMLLLLVYRIPYVRKAYLDDLVVDSNFRKQGIATLLFQEALSFAKKKNAAYVDFTSRDFRGAGNTLYEKFGFTKRETNSYRVIFDYGKKT